MTTHKDGWMLSRREFAAVPALVVGAAAGALAQRALLTAGEVIDRIKANLGVPWRGGPTDTFKSGDVDTPIAGIATTVMSTFDVIKRAAAARKNMVITHEPTYWLGNDDVRSFTNDALYQKKLQFIRDNNIVVWRFHDHLHARQPDMSAVGLADAIGWSKYQSKDDPRVYVLPRLSLRDLAKEVGTNGSLYRVAKPIVNVSRAPNDWQTFDIIQHAPTCSNGALTSPGDITLIHNGVLVLDRAVPRVRNDHCQPGMTEMSGPIMLQDHEANGPMTVMRFRNIWFRPLTPTK